jgi:hypothetical protein
MLHAQLNVNARLKLLRVLVTRGPIFQSDDQYAYTMRVGANDSRDRRLAPPALREDTRRSYISAIFHPAGSMGGYYTISDGIEDGGYGFRCR